MSIEALYSKRRQIRAAWDPNRAPSKEMIYDLLKRTQKISPSKQNLYPFKIHAFGPNNEKEKRIVEKICCLYTEGSVNNFDRSSSELKEAGQDNNLPAWVLVFELRKCEPNTFIKEYSQMYKGDSPYVTPDDVQGTASRFGQISEKRFRESTNKALACVEVGMFTKILAGLCLENDLAISYIKSFPEWTWKGSRGEYSKNTNENGLDWDELPQIIEAPILVVQIGYKADMVDPLSSTVEVDGVIHSTKGGVLLEDKPHIDEIVHFKD
jgi:hypothetical protein